MEHSKRFDLQAPLTGTHKIADGMGLLRSMTEKPEQPGATNLSTTDWRLGMISYKRRRPFAIWKRLFVAAMAIGAMAISAVPVQATFPETTAGSHSGDLNEDRTTGAVFTIRPNGTRERQVTIPPQGYVDRNPDISPDGKRIAFEREGVDCGPDCSYDEIFVVDVNGSHLTQLTHNATGKVCGDAGGFCNGSPAWSPDGKLIAFRRASGPVVDDLIQNQGISVMNADGSGIHPVTETVNPAEGEAPTRNGRRTGRRSCFSGEPSGRPCRRMASRSGSSTCQRAMSIA